MVSWHINSVGRTCKASVFIILDSSTTKAGGVTQATDETEMKPECTRLFIYFHIFSQHRCQHM